LIDLTPRERVPLQWAATQNNLGIALETLGEREEGTARLEEAVTASVRSASTWPLLLARACASPGPFQPRRLRERPPR
jgi:hypothetical protein